MRLWRISVSHLKKKGVKHKGGENGLKKNTQAKYLSLLVQTSSRQKKKKKKYRYAIKYNRKQNTKWI